MNNPFQIVRESLGFNQEAMAGLLGIQISAYRMAESGHRKLPPEASAWLNWISNTVLSLPLATKMILGKHLFVVMIGSRILGNLLKNTIRNEFEKLANNRLPDLCFLLLTSIFCFLVDAYTSLKAVW